MKSKLGKIVIGLVVLGVIAIVALMMSIDTIIKRGFERIGPQVTKVDTKLDGVNVEVFSGKGSMKGLVIGNPEGYKTAHAMNVGKASMELVAGSVFKDKIIIKSINVDAPEITLEGTLSGNNLTKILSNIEAFVGAEKKGEVSTKTEKGKERRIQVDDFVISNAKVNLSLDIAFLGGKSASVTIPDIHLTGLGQNAEGITPAELAEKVTREIVAKVIPAATKAVADLGKSGAEAVKNLGKGGVEGAGNAVKGLGDMFKKK
jgi:hypothetical protein